MACVDVPKRIKTIWPSPSLTLRGSDANSGCSVSNALTLHRLLDGWAHHLLRAHERANGNHHNTFTGRLFNVRDDPSSLVISSFHFDFPHTNTYLTSHFPSRIAYNHFDKPESFHIQAPSLSNIFLASYVFLGKAGSSVGTNWLMNSIKDVKIVLLSPPTYFKLYECTIADSLRYFVLSWSGLFASLTKL